MKNLKIKKKLFISYAVILVLLVLGTLISIFNLARIGDQVEEFYNGPYTVKGSANNIDMNFEALQKSVYRAMANEDLDITNEAIQNANEAAAKIQEQLPIVQKNFQGDPQIVARLQSELTKLAPMREEVLKLAKENRNTEAAAYMETNNIPSIKKAQAELDSLIQAADQNGLELLAELSAAQVRATVILIILGVASVIISVIFGSYITRGITKPVSELEAASRNLAEGALREAKVEYVSKDELGSLADSMRTTISRLSNIIEDITYLQGEMSGGNFDLATGMESSYVGEFRPILMAMRTMNKNLSDAMRQINESAEQVASGSEQVSSGAQALSQGATEQASSIEELSAVINDISRQVKGNADNAIDASGKASSTREQMEASNRRMQEMIQAMQDISSSSSEIGKIIKTIEDIAFQTNILALNAAVEAARAGAAGKGFAVVADEVRSLASKSSEASKSTATLIETSLTAVENGTKIVDETAKALSEAVDGARMVTETIDKISEASNQQAESIEQVTQGIDQISSVIQTNSATAEESAASSEELSGQAQMLKSLVGRFKLKASDGSAVKAVSGQMKPAKSAGAGSPVHVQSSPSDKY